MKSIHLTAYGNPVENLKMVEVSEPNAPSASEALVRMEYAPIKKQSNTPSVVARFYWISITETRTRHKFVTGNGISRERVSTQNEK